MIQSRSVGWRNDQPPIGSVVEVWRVNQTTLAYHDGHVWRTVEGVELSAITHWRPRGAVAQVRRVLPQ